MTSPYPLRSKILWLPLLALTGCSPGPDPGPPLPPVTASWTTSTQSLSESAGLVSLAIELSEAVSSDVTFVLADRGAAELDRDYEVIPRARTLPAGSTRLDLAVRAIDDDLYEGPEDLELYIAAVQGSSSVGAGDAPLLVADLIDDDPLPSLGFRVATSQFAESSGIALVHVELDALAGVDVRAAVNPGGSASFHDYSLSETEVVICAGHTSVALEVRLVLDGLREDPEELVLTLTNPTNAQLGTAQHTLTIVDPLAPGGLSFVGRTQSGAEGLYETAADGSTAVLHWELPPFARIPASADSRSRTGAVKLSPDGQWLAIRVDGETDDRLELFIAPLGSGVPRRVSVDIAGFQDVDSGFQWSPSSRYLAYTILGDRGLFVVKPDGTGSRGVANLAGVQRVTSFAWSPDADDDRLAYTRAEGSQRVELRTVRPDGTDDREVSGPMDDDGVELWEWSPDGQHLAYVADPEDDSHQQLWSANRDGTERTNLSAAGGPFDNVEGFLWSPRGDQIAFVVSRDLFTVDRTGGTWTELTDSDVPSSLDFEGLYEWSPLGNFMAVAADEDGGTEDALWIVTPDGSTRTKVSDSSLEGTGRDVIGVAWAPLEDALAYRVEGDSFFDATDLYIVNRDGDDSERISAGIDVNFVKWSPDGTRVGMAGDEGSTWHLYTATAADDWVPVRLSTIGPAVILPDFQWDESQAHVAFRRLDLTELPLYLAEDGIAESAVLSPIGSPQQVDWFHWR